MFTKKYYRKFVKSLMALKSLSRIRLKIFVVMEEVPYLFMNDYDNF